MQNISQSFQNFRDNVMQSTLEASVNIEQNHKGAADKTNIVMKKIISVANKIFSSLDMNNYVSKRADYSMSVSMIVSRPAAAPAPAAPAAAARRDSDTSSIASSVNSSEDDSKGPAPSIVIHDPDGKEVALGSEEENLAEKQAAYLRQVTLKNEMQNELVSIRRPAVDLQEVIENKTEVIAELNTRFAKEEEAAAAAEEEAIARVVYEDDFPKETAPVVEDKVAAPVVEESDYETDGEDSDVEDEVAAPAPQQPRGIGRHLTVQNAALGVLATGVAVGAGVGGYMTCGPDMCVSVGLAAGRVALAGVGLPV